MVHANENNNIVGGRLKKRYIECLDSLRQKFDRFQNIRKDIVLVHANGRNRWRLVVIGFKVSACVATPHINGTIFFLSFTDSLSKL